VRRSFVSLVACLGAMGTAGLAQEIHQEKSLYRNVIVFDDGDLRCMKFERQSLGRQTCVSLRNPDNLVFNYTRMMLGALYLKPAPKTVLVLGLGGATIPSALQKMDPDMEIDCVELDPAVVKVARQFFGFNPGPKTRVMVDDGRVYVKRALKQPRRYDLIVLDAFDHVYVPEHMMTREFLSEVRALLKPDGVLASNTFSSSRLYPSESATYFSAFGPYFNLKLDNRVILTRNNGLPEPSELQANAAQAEAKLRAFGTGRDWLLPLFSTVTQAPPDARLLTDQYSPANLLNTRP
jgi:spermidine synthase